MSAALYNRLQRDCCVSLRAIAAQGAEGRASAASAAQALGCDLATLLRDGAHQGAWIQELGLSPAMLERIEDNVSRLESLQTSAVALFSLDANEIARLLQRARALGDEFDRQVSKIRPENTKLLSLYRLALIRPLEGKLIQRLVAVMAARQPDVPSATLKQILQHGWLADASPVGCEVHVDSMRRLWDRFHALVKRAQAWSGARGRQEDPAALKYDLENLQGEVDQSKSRLRADYSAEAVPAVLVQCHRLLAYRSECILQVIDAALLVDRMQQSEPKLSELAGNLSCASSLRGVLTSLSSAGEQDLPLERVRELVVALDAAMAAEATDQRIRLWLWPCHDTLEQWQHTLDVCQASVQRSVPPCLGLRERAAQLEAEASSFLPHLTDIQAIMQQDIVAGVVQLAQTLATRASGLMTAIEDLDDTCLQADSGDAEAAGAGWSSGRSASQPGPPPPYSEATAQAQHRRHRATSDPGHAGATATPTATAASAPPPPSHLPSHPQPTIAVSKEDVSIMCDSAMSTAHEIQAILEHAQERRACDLVLANVSRILEHAEHLHAQLREVPTGSVPLGYNPAHAYHLLDQVIPALREGHVFARAQMLCIVCRVSERVCFVQPCNHLAYCASCVLQVQSHGCILCSQPITSYGTVRHPGL